MERKSIMWTYISQEKSLMMSLLHDKTIQVKAENLKAINVIYFTAHGSSYNAAMCVSNFISTYAGVRCYCYTPCQLLYHQHSLFKEDTEHTLVIAISQTGTSRGVLEAVKAVKQYGFLTLGISSICDSQLTKVVDHVLYMRCKEELCNAKTKGYSCTLLLLILFGMYLGKAKKLINIDDIYQELQTCVLENELLIDTIIKWCEQNQFGKDMQDFYIIGYDLHYGTALEGQLKMMETMCIPTMFNDLLEFSHGMHRSIKASSTILLLKTRHELEGMMEDTYQYLKHICKNVYIIDTVLADGDSQRLYLPDSGVTHSILQITTAIQIFSVFAPEYHELDPNREANEEYTKVVATRVL